MLIIGVLLLVVLFVDLLLFTYWDRYYLSFFIMVGTLVAAFILLPEVATFVRSVNWATVLMGYLPAWLVVGFVVAVLKWISYIRRVGDSIADHKGNFNDMLPKLKPEDVGLHTYGSFHDANTRKEVEENQQVFDAMSFEEKFVKYMVVNYNHIEDRRLQEVISDNKVATLEIRTSEDLVDALAPRAIKNTGRIGFWTLQWPFALLSLILEDVILRIGRHISRLFDEVFTKYAKNVVRKALGV